MLMDKQEKNVEDEEKKDMQDNEVEINFVDDDINEDFDQNDSD